MWQTGERGTPSGADKAFEELRKKGLSAAIKKSSRAAAEGLVGIARGGAAAAAAIVEVNSETDFVARNESFQLLVAQLAQVRTATSTARSSGTCAVLNPSTSCQLQRALALHDSGAGSGRGCHEVPLEAMRAMRLESGKT